MKKILFFAIVFYGFYAAFSTTKPHEPPEDSHVIMYSLTTCGYCKLKAKELAENNIDHVEYFMDEDSSRRDELHKKMADAGFASQQYGTPTFDVYGEILLNNPKIEVIQAIIKKHTKT